MRQIYAGGSNSATAVIGRPALLLNPKHQANRDRVRKIGYGQAIAGAKFDRQFYLQLAQPYRRLYYRGYRRGCEHAAERAR
jgi:hypothetical protein